MFRIRFVARVNIRVRVRVTIGDRFELVLVFV